jgi:crotonobetainyl-CoA:carnitine CoA-transferase CaiB-like acyl-CoA transferase
VSGALDGIVIADFSRVLAGPYATMLLADLGASVIKVERPGRGDDTRQWGPPFAADGQASYFHSVNRNKTSVAWDLTSSEGQKQAHELVTRADVVVENFMVGKADELGLGFAQVCAVNPSVIYCSISGFGSERGARLPGYDLLVQAMGGLMSITGEHGHPMKVGVALVDVLTGLHAAVGILAALHHRDVSGEGQRIEVNLLSVLLASMVNQSAAFATAGEIPTALGNAHPSIAPYATFAAMDRPMIIAVGNDAQFHALATALDRLEWADDPRFATNVHRVLHRAELTDAINGVLRSQQADYWHDLLTRHGVPCGPINAMDQAFALAENLGLNPIVNIPSADGSVASVASPLHLSRTPVHYRSAAPELPVITP